MSELLNTWHIDFAPLIAMNIILAFGLIAGAILFASLFIYRRGALWRALAVMVMIGALLNPSLIEEKREAVKDIAVLVVDDSPSQQFGARREKTDQAAAALNAALQKLPDLDIRVIHAPTEGTAAHQTDLFEAARRAYGDTPPTRRAGIIMLSDGQIHDVPDTADTLGPVHVLLSGEKNETDRQLVITQAPSYGIVGQRVSVTFTVKDAPEDRKEPVQIILRRDQGDSEILSATPGEPQTVELPIDHGGKNIFEFEAAPLPGELTEMNNKAALVINGVRDRLRVLLVSGRPHMGGRTWRNLLTSDPSVDLVHFTILRDPQKLDMTPQKELSLIPFPFHELFEVKLNEFDLIIFDRYSLNKILPPYYFDNIARYIENGGALLEASGPEYAGQDSLFETALGPILPGRPTGAVLEKSFRPTLTQTGKRHPVTEDLAAAQSTWGTWLRQVGLNPAQGSNILMTGADNTPLLMLSHVGEGRIAQLASDQIWLWSRGYDGGGPQTQLLRRLAHWLMKEPELEEEMLELSGDQSGLLIRRRSLDDTPRTVSLTFPDGTQKDIRLEKTAHSPFLEAHSEAPQAGVYAARDGDLKTLAVIGDLSAPEYQTLLSSETPTQAITQATGGSITWMDDGLPSLRHIPTGRNYAGRGWIGLQKNGDYIVTGIKAIPLLPLWGMLALLACATIWSWWRESRI